MEMSPDNKELGIFIALLLMIHGMVMYAFVIQIINEIRGMRALLTPKAPPFTGDSDAGR